MYQYSRSVRLAARAAMLALVLAATVAACSSSSSSVTPAVSGSGTAPGSATTASGQPSGSAGASAEGSSIGSVVPSEVPPSQDAISSGTPAPTTACITGLSPAHVDPALEEKLPCVIGNTSLARFSFKLSSYIASTSGGDRELYAPWLVQFGLTPDDVTMAVVVADPTTESFVIHAISVPSVADDKLVSSFSDQARKAGWPVGNIRMASRSLMEIVDPSAREAGSLSVGYVFAKDHVLYTIITDDPNLLLEAIVKLP
jgi:hypothetical protein